MALNRDEGTLYVAIANPATASADGVAEVNLKQGIARRCYRTALASNDAPGAASVLSHYPEMGNSFMWQLLR